MKKIEMTKKTLVLLLSAGFCLMGCKDNTSESQGNEQEIETADSYDETKAPTGEPGNDAMSPGADGGTGLPYDSTSADVKPVPERSKQ